MDRERKGTGHTVDDTIYPGAPEWIKRGSVAALLALMLVVALRFTGCGRGGHGPGMHGATTHGPESSRADARSLGSETPPAKAPEPDGVPSSSKSATPTQVTPASSSVEGCWEFVAGTLRGEFSLAVVGASLSGSVTLHGNTLEIQQGKLARGRFSFVVEHGSNRAQFSGRKDGARLRGSMSMSGTSKKFAAERCPDGEE